MKHYPFPKIRQYHQVIKDLKLKHQFVGLDSEGNPIYDHTKPLPKIKFSGRVKLHGTNAAIVTDLRTGETYAQSRENVITPEKDNAGFAAYIASRKFCVCMHGIPDGYTHQVTYGEWCGGSIQAGVALNELPKMFVIFGQKIVGDGKESIWYPLSEPVYATTHALGRSGENMNPLNIQFLFGDESILRAPTYEIEVDLERPDKAIEQMNKWVEEIDKECPFAKTFGVSGHGEGLVFRPEGDHSFAYAFKVKGESHSKSKIKKLPTVDVVKMDSIQQAVETHCHEDRLNQGYYAIVKSEADETPEKIGEFVRWMVNDIWEEEGDALVASDISRKEIGSAVSRKAAAWFKNKLNQSV